MWLWFGLWKLLGGDPWRLLVYSVYADWTTNISGFHINVETSW
jgi:hypothetical protein